MELNDNVQVTLTERGAKILNETNASMKLLCPNMNWKTDYKGGDEYSTQLWDIIGQFGSCCSAGSELVFTSLKEV